MPQDTPPAAAPLALLLDADRAITRLGADDPYPFYELLHRTAARIAPVEAFYVCLYSEADRSLYFPYNYDNGVYDYPSTFPLGGGPTSWVVRHKRPFVWRSLDEQETRGPAGVPFGDLTTATHSAAHLPIPAPGAGPDAPLLGVLSAQCYTPDAYDADALCLLQWLADRAGLALAHAQASSLAAERQRHAASLSDRFVQMLNRISRDAQAVGALVPPDCPALRQAVADFLRTCYRSQTEANEFSRHPSRLPSPPPSPTAVPADPLALLTEREHEILRLLPSGASRKQLADQLHISDNTMKKHLDNIYAKLGVTNRTQAIQKINPAS